MWNNIRKISDDKQNVTKYVFERHDAVAEAVLYRYPDYKTRTVICCSTQSGCPVGCRFCGAGDFFIRNLDSAEIVSQVMHCINETGINPSDMGRLQIMFMSMGEPLLNISSMRVALRSLHAFYPNAALLISTSAPKVNYSEIQNISRRIPTIGIQFSIHESTDEKRDKLIPFRHKLSLSEISREGERWNQATGRKPFFNYCVHNENNSESDADRLLQLFIPHIWEATISVICERNEGLPATNDFQRQLATDFANLLLERGFNVRVFDPAGQDTIGGGCGQLWFVQRWAQEHNVLVRSTVGTGLPEIHTPHA